MTAVDAPAPLDELLPVVTRLAREAVEAAATGALAGPTWRPGIVEAPAAPGDDAIVTLDGDDGGDTITAKNVSGAGLPIGARVLVMFAPPHGVYITAALDQTAVASGSLVWNVATSEAQMPGHLAWGQTVSGGDALYPILWERLPATFKSGSSIVLPAIAGRTVAARGAVTGFTTTGQTGGLATVTLTAGQSGVPAHTHPAPGNGYFYGAGGGKIQGDGTYGFQLDTQVAANSAQNASQGHENWPPYITLNAYLKT